MHTNMYTHVKKMYIHMSAPVYVVFMYSALCVQRCWMLVFLSTCSCRDIISSLAPRGWPSHEFDHKGCIIVEEEAQAGGGQREEDLRPAAQAQALLEAPGKKTPTAGDSRSFFVGKRWANLKDPIDYKPKPLQHKTYPKNKTKHRTNQKSSKISSKGPRMGAASNGTFTSNFSVTLIRQRALMAPLSSPGSSCRFNGLRPKFIGKDCAVPSPKKPGRKSERWDSGLANSVLDRSWIEIDGYYILDGAI